MSDQAQDRLGRLALLYLKLGLYAENSEAIEPVPVKSPDHRFVFLESVWFSSQ
jgi:hypothetical protein